jgi:Domain of unknown function (DUF4062)
MAVDAVFISSVISDFEDVRKAAAEAVSASGMYPVRSEELSADPSASRRALLDQVASAEYYLLLLGARYGDFASGESSPTEDEFREATRLGKPMLVLVQEVELEPRQRQFLEGIRGTWGEGVFYGKFSGAEDITAKVAQALARRRAEIVEDGPAAQSRTAALASERDRSGWGQSTSVRLVAAPLRQTVLLDAVALDDSTLGDDLIAALRAGGAIPQSVGMVHAINSERVELVPPSQQSGSSAKVEVDGAILISGTVAADGMLGGMQIDRDKLTIFLRAAGRSAQMIWDRIDPRGEVGQVAVAVAVLGAQHLAYGVSNGSVSMGGSVPETVVVPDPPHIVRRTELDQEAVASQLQASVKRVFADAGRVQ